MRQAVILSLKKQQIDYQNKSINRKLGLLTTISVFFTILACFSCMKVINTTTTNELFSIANTVYNPIRPLFSDGSDVVFTSASSALPVTQELKITVPVLSSKVTNMGNHLSFQIDTSIMILSPEVGVVRQIEVDATGKKTLVIQHSGEISTKLIGCDVIGVAVGEKVTKGQEVATGCVGGVIDMYVLNNNMIMQLTLNHQTVSWQ